MRCNLFPFFLHFDPAIQKYSDRRILVYSKIKLLLRILIILNLGADVRRKGFNFQNVGVAGHVIKLVTRIRRKIRLYFSCATKQIKAFQSIWQNANATSQFYSTHADNIIHHRENCKAALFLLRRTPNIDVCSAL